LKQKQYKVVNILFGKFKNNKNKVSQFRPECLISHYRSMNLNFVKIFIIGALGLYSGLAAANTFFVDGDFGDDSWNGSSNTPGFPNGPKKTINAAIKIANSSDLLEIAGTVYPDRINLKKSLTFILLDVISVKSITMNAAGVKLTIVGGRDLVVSDTINCINGYIDASLTNCNLIAATTCKVLGGSRLSFVEGRFYRVNIQTVVTDLFFPMGTGQDYRPVFLSFNQNTSLQNRYIAQVYLLAAPTGTLPTGIKNISKVHYWNLRYTGLATPSSFKVRVQYDSGKIDDEVFEPSKLRLLILQNGNSNYINLAGNGTAKLKGTIASANTTDTLGNIALANVTGGVNTLGQKFPLAKFGYSGICVNSPIQFRDSSFSNKSAITRRLWDFGTGNPKDTSNLALPKFTFTSNGPVTVSLRVWNSLGFDDVYTLQIDLKNGPKSKFLTGDGCLGRPLKFDDSTTIDAPDTLKIRKWELGDGNTRSQASFSYTYALPISFTVKLITVSNSGCTDTFKKDISINKTPNPTFIASNICFAEKTLFNGTGGNAGDSISNWKWFVNGVFENTGKKITKVFAAAAIYDVSVAVVSQSGCLDTILKKVTIFQPPKSLFYLDPSIAGNDSIQCYAGNNFKLKDVSKTFQGQVLNTVYIWGTPPTPGANSITMTQSGSFGVKMIVTSDKGCKDSSEHVYKVFDKINVKFSALTFCLPKAAEFRDSSTAGAATITNVFWSFGNSYTGSGNPVSHNYSFGGKYNVWDIVTTSDGCKDSVMNVVGITSKPSINLNVGSNNPFCAYDSLRVQVAGGAYIKWNNGDTNRIHYLFNSGIYKVTAFTSPFCFVSDSVTAQAFPPVFPNAGPDTSLIKGRYLILQGGGGIKYFWTPAGICETQDSVRTRVKPLVTTMCYLKVTDGNNCVGYDSVLVLVKAPLFIRIPNMITPNGDGKNDAWDLREVPNIENSKVSIYSSLGELVYVKNVGYDHTWLGTNNTGGNLPVGNYLYIIEIPTEKEPLKGYLHVAR